MLPLLRGRRRRRPSAGSAPEAPFDLGRRGFAAVRACRRGLGFEVRQDGASTGDQETAIPKTNASTTARTTRAGVLLALSAVTLSGCASFGSLTPDSRMLGGAGDPAEVVDSVPFEDVQAEIDEAVSVVDGFWAAHWSEFYGGSYVSPTVVGTYDSTDPADSTSCDGEPADEDNALYCTADHSVMWDRMLMSEMYAEGDANVYLVVAHEWGHAIQAQLDDTEVWTAEELQADCFAGATLYGAADDGVLAWDEGDTAELARGLTDLSDTTAWTGGADDHGDPFDRIDAFNDGRTYGVSGCFPVAE